ncbi:MAG: TonB-dependent receptor [Bacteroidales bacterium]|nr:TonB-dependent receptor [Bacteroidales bacterium]
MLNSILIAVGLLSAGLPEHVTDSLQPVTVTADKGVVVSRTDTLAVRNSFLISEILHQSPGIILGDYGGFAGLKTVSLRGFGSPHTSIYIDGVKVGNVQSGQNDLGMMGVENYEAAIIDYAQNSLSFRTLRPSFDRLPVRASVKFAGGSFGTWLPSARFDFRLSENLALSANAAGIISKGDFKYGDDAVRQNNDIRQVRAGLDLFGLMDSGDYHIKGYFNTSDRGTPGSVSWPSDDRQKDMNVFVQGLLRKKFSQLYSLQVSAKGAYDDIFYSSSWGDSRYGQTEFQLNSSHLFRINRWWNVSFAADIQWDGLKSTNYQASRFTASGSLTSSFRLKCLSANIALEYNGAFDSGARSRNAFSPSVDMRLTLAEGLDMVAFARRAYRVPTFNELYYVGYGNPDLNPEDAWLTDVGFDFNRQLSQTWLLKAKLDGFYNSLTDKITSAPTVEDPNIWLPYNIGKVRSAGFDAVAGTSYASAAWKFSFDAKYSFQSAVDMTPDSYTFGRQIPYVARHSVVLDATVAWNGLEFNPRWNMKAGRTDSAGALADWNTLDLNLDRPFRIRNAGVITVRLAARNILDSHYELVSGYPMPGRSFMAGLEFTLL